MPKKPSKKRIKPGEKYDPALHGELRLGLSDRRQNQQKPHFSEGSGGWTGVVRTPLYYRYDPVTKEVIRDKSTGKMKDFPAERIGPKDRRKKKE